MGKRIADRLAGFAGSWTFIITFAIVLAVYTVTNVTLSRKAECWRRFTLR